MDTCAVEVGMLKKKPCGQAAAAKCANCEMAICAKHAVRQTGGKFMCAECSKAQRAFEKNVGNSAPVAAAPKAAAPAAKAPAPAAKPAPAATPAPSAKPAPAAPAAAQPAAKPAPATKEFKLEETGPIEFTPTKKP